jgi:lipopolysaccharide biosynthesis protein
MQDHDFDPARTVAASRFFDHRYYARQLGSLAPQLVGASRYDLAAHFVSNGWHAMLDPSVRFCTAAYLRDYQDVESSGLNPLLHYIAHGRAEGRVPQRVRPSFLLRMSNRLQYLDSLASRNGGWVGLMRRATSIAVRQGPHGIRHILAIMKMRGYSDPDGLSNTASVRNASVEAIPLFLHDGQCADTPPDKKIALHIHVYYIDLVHEFIARLNNCTRPVDLFISVPDGGNRDEVERLFVTGISNGGRIVVESCENKGRDIAPMIKLFGQALLDYDIIGHMHTKRSPHNSLLSDWLTSTLDTLLGTKSSPEGIAVRADQVFGLLCRDAKLVCAQPPLGVIPDPSGWGTNQRSAEILLRRAGIPMPNLPQRIDFPNGSMFWARRDAVQALLNLPVAFDDFPEEPIPADGTLAHALERLIFLLASRITGKIYQLQDRAYPDDARYYENQIDFSEAITGTKPGILAYYLPQFHPTPENDEWHGKGFTEWTKVRTSQPLFDGHRQQRFPHADIGYYHLDHAGVLAQQAKMMRRAGVSGMVFYHYWFSGRRILEKPAQMLLADPSIDMPFCFCWANENWTRRWDGSESDVLLEQIYSRDDARAFIRELIPCFRDPRYIRHDGRPLIFVYRPKLLPAEFSYAEIWAEECRANGLPAPFVIGTLKDGIDDIRAQGMDAAVERPLHDWTGGAVEPIDGTLNYFGNRVHGVLPYDKVASHYAGVSYDKPFPVIRSLLPCFDNTPRYGERAHITHEVNPESFQDWLERLLADVQQRKDISGQFIVVNAWNEWAETAMLEPDTQFGYAYLNAIGRVLTQGAQEPARSVAEKPKSHVHLHFPHDIELMLTAHSRQMRVLIACLKQAMDFDDTTYSTNSDLLAEICEIDHAVSTPETNTDRVLWIASIRSIFAFAPHFFEHLIDVGLKAPDEEILPSFHFHPRKQELSRMSRLGRVTARDAFYFPLTFRRASLQLSDKRLLRVADSAFATPVSEDTRGSFPVVNCILRYHVSGEMELLRRALASLAVQQNVCVSPIVMTQDLNDAQIAQVWSMLDVLPWRRGAKPVVENLMSAPETPDRRAALLSRGLQLATADWVGFLDYDDLLFPNAYQLLLSRMNTSKKAVVFGRVYRSFASNRFGPIATRDRTYEYGQTYEDFLTVNHAPIHSYLLNRKKLDLGSVSLPEGQRYMEDYLLLLQIVTKDNADWASLRLNMYVGDYMHYEVGYQTLSITDQSARNNIINSDAYRRDEATVEVLKKKLLKAG